MGQTSTIDTLTLRLPVPGMRSMRVVEFSGEGTMLLAWVEGKLDATEGS